MQKKTVFIIFLVLLAILMTLLLSDLTTKINFAPTQTPKNQTSSEPQKQSKIIQKSVPQGDEIADLRLPEDVCETQLPIVQTENPNAYCTLTTSESISAIDGAQKCIDGASIAGCFACTFKCE